MRAFGSASVVLPDVKVMPVAYNPDGGKRVQLAWQRFSNSPSYVRSADPVCPACPAACR